MIEIEDEKELVVIEKDIQYIYEKLKPNVLSFRGSTLDKINTKIIDSSNIKDMSYMFAEMKNIENLDLSEFDTSSATSMTAMFYQSTFKNLDVSNFDTSNVTMMNAMFQACRSLETLEVKNIDTSKVTNMSYMFAFCSPLKILDLSGFNFESTTGVSNMFLEDNNLEEIKGILDFKNVTATADMFGYASKLKEVRIKNLKANILLNTAFVLSADSINYILMNVQQISESKTITLGSNMSKASQEAIANATSKGFTVV